MIFRRGLLALLLACAPAAGQAAPSRIVSLNLCTDQLLVRLADPGRIAALTTLARDPALSVVAAEAARLPATDGGAEAVLALHPDLVLAGSYGARPTLRLLKARGVPVVELPPAEDWPAIEAQTLAVARLIGAEGKGRALVEAMNRRLAVLAARPRSDRLAVIWQAGGFTPGAGSLADRVLAAAGLRNLAAEQGIAGYGYLSLERLVAAAPRLLILDTPPPGRPSLSQRLAAHPALARLGRPVAIDQALWSCGGPWTVEAAEILADAP